MHTHRIDSFLLTENLRLEIVHEANPFFAGEPISLVVRIRHLGSQNEYFTINEKIKELQQEIENMRRERQQEVDNGHKEDSKPWIMKSLMKAFNADNHGEDLSKIGLEKHSKSIELLTKQLSFHKPVELISGYLQVSGVFQFDPEFLREFKMDKTSTNMSGMDGFMNHGGDCQPGIHDKNDISKFINSKHSPSTVGLASISDERAGLLGEGNSLFAINNNDYNVDSRRTPILLIPQTLLFTEVVLEPGMSKVFRFKTSNLPLDLPPSYNISKNMNVNYNLEFGVSMLFVKDVRQSKIHVPISIAPYVTANGSQYTFKLNEKLIIMEPGVVKELKQKPNQKRPSSSSIGTPRRMSSFMLNQETNDHAKSVESNFVKLIKSNQNGDKDIEELVDLQMQMQFKDLNQDDLSNTSNELSQNIDTSYSSRKPNSVANNISNLKSLNSKFFQDTSGEDLEGVNNLVPQISNLQNFYQINWNGQPITKLTLSNPFYTTADDIDLVLTLDPSSPPLHKVSAVTVSLEAFELVNRDYASDSSKISKPQGNQVYEAHAICFDKCDSIPLKLIFPKTPMNQMPSQFRTDVFQFKWMLVFKFVLVPRIENINLEQFYEDKKGVLFHAKETLEGEEFSCHIPIPILPSSGNFGGW